MQPFWGVQRAAPTPCHEIMHEQRIARAIAEALQQYRVVKIHAKHSNTYVARGELTK